jgi:hypothetical protein
MFGNMDQHDTKATEFHRIEKGSPEQAQFAAAVRDVLSEMEGGYSTRKGGHTRLHDDDKFFSDTLPHAGKNYSLYDVVGNWVYDRPGPKHVFKKGK